ncbi:hypothetical protein F5883DRAFT_412158 [Diaporthe sp. PMI_573]|nr:hypothetical protein F5883DRAFT_412158 [Diaporthaceae sp. PMI_573]
MGNCINSYAKDINLTCLPNTRVDLLKQIRTWVDNPTALAVFWLNGMAGMGKLIISQTVAKFLADINKLGASFFFKRGENDRSYASKLFTTVASQLARCIPTLAGLIMEAINANPTILNIGL